MAEQVVTITGVFTEQGNNSRGPWTRWDVKDAGGNKYQTFDEGLGRKAEAAKGSSVKVTYEEVQRGQYVNKVLKAVEPQVAEREAIAAVNAAAQATPYNGSETERQLRIMRQSGLERAILATQALGIEVSGVDELFEISDQFVDYFVNGAPVAEEAAA